MNSDVRKKVEAFFKDNAIKRMLEEKKQKEAMQAQVAEEKVKAQERKA